MAGKTQHLATRRRLWAAKFVSTCLGVVAVWSAGNGVRPAWAAVPSTTNVEGVLSTVAGGPVADGPYSLVFSLYTTDIGGTPAWTEGPVQVLVKNGSFNHQLGSKVPLNAALLNLPKVWLGVQVASDPELPRQSLGATPYALRASVADGLDCSGCIGVGQLDGKVLADFVKSSSLAKVATSGSYSDLTGTPDLAPYAKSANLAKVATSGNYSDLAGAPDMSVFAKISGLAKVAETGNYADLTGAPDLSVYAKSANLAKVATTGSYGDLSDKPVLATIGSSCGTGLVLRGFKADGALDCVAGNSGPIDPKNLPPDGLDEVSNGLLSNQFVDSTSGTPNVPIKDNNPVGVADSLLFPDLGIAQGLTISVDITNSDISSLRISVFDPDAVEYVLCGGVDSGGKPYTACGKKGDALKTSFPTPTANVAGNLASWVGKNPKGNWILKVVDSGFLNNANDGQITSWSVGIQTLSSKKVAIKGNTSVEGTLAVSGSVMVGNDTAACTAAKVGSLRYTVAKGLEICIGTNWVAAVAKPAIFSGFCSKHGTGGGWNAYCLDGAAFNTAGDYFSVTDTNAGVITVKIAGYYRIHLNLLYNNCWNTDGVQVLKSGTRIASGYSSSQSGVWGMHVVDVTWPLAVGDTIQVQAYNSGCTGYAYHQGSASGVWSKFTMMYAGSL